MSPKAGNVLLEQVAPRLRATISRLPQVGADDHEELYQDGLAIAAQMLHSAEENEKEVTAGNIAYYATKQLACGRRSTYGGRVDALSSACQLDGNSEVIPLFVFQEDSAPLMDAGDDAVLSMGDLLAARIDDPAVAAARNLDWEAFLSEHEPLARQMVELLLAGEAVRDLKDIYGWSDSTLSNRKRAMAAELRECFGNDCLREVGREPAWFNDLRIGQEREFNRRERGLQWERP